MLLLMMMTIEVKMMKEMSLHVDYCFYIESVVVVVVEVNEHLVMQ